MKILITTLCYPDEYGFMGGVFTHNQAKALAARGHEVAVLNIDMRSIRKRRPLGFSTYRLDGVKVYRYAFPCGPFPDFVYTVAPMLAQRTFLTIAEHWGLPDVLHGHFWNGGLLARTIAGKSGIPYLVTEHGTDVLNDRLSTRGGRLAKSVYTDAAEVIAVGEALRSKICAFTDHPIQVIPNILPDYMRHVPHEKNCAGAPFIFFSVGGLIPRKRFDLLLEAYAGMPCKDQCCLRIVGEGPLLTRLEALAQELGIKEQVMFLGAVANQQLPEWYSQADCFVLASDVETFGVVYAEAMACGLPVIATRCGGPEDFVKEDNGVLADKNDVKALSNAMQFMFENKNRFKSSQIAAETQKFYGEDTICKQLLSAYQQAIGKRAKRGKSD